MLRTIYHYTKFDSLKSIINSEGLTLYATHYSHYNRNDYKYTRELSEPVIKDICEERGIEYDNELTFEPYIISFSTSAKSKTMWGERFGDNGKGIRLGFDLEEFDEFAYAPPEPHVFLQGNYSQKKEEIKLWLLNCLYSYGARSNNLQEDLMEISACLIPEKYKSQDEYRFILPERTKIYFNNKGEFIIEQIKNGPKIEATFCFKSILKSIMFGSNVKDNDVKTLREHLQNIGGYEHVKILKSRFKI